MTTLLFHDELLDAQLMRAIGASGHHGADIGEALQAMKDVKESDPSTWYEAWNSLGERAFALGEEQQQQGHRLSARNAFLRACTYLRTAGSILYSTPIDPRMVHSNGRQSAAFQRAAALMDTPVEIIGIPFEGSTLPGYFLSAASGTGIRRATVIGLGGYDSSAEEVYFYFAAPALARGYNVILFDGPGQGAALLQKGLVMRPDWETVVTPVIDFLLSRDDVDPDRIALAGLSLGGFLAPRAAAKEHRLAALVADSGSYDLYAGVLDRLPTPVAKGYRAANRTARAVVNAMMQYVAKKPTGGWALRRGMVVHGVAGPLAYADVLQDFRLEGCVQTISCPTLVTHSEGDDVGATAPQLFDALTVQDKTLMRFTVAEGAGQHCQTGARTLSDTRVFGWLDDRLHPEILA